MMLRCNFHYVLLRQRSPQVFDHVETPLQHYLSNTVFCYGRRPFLTILHNYGKLQLAMVMEKRLNHEFNIPYLSISFSFHVKFFFNKLTRSIIVQFIFNNKLLLLEINLKFCKLQYNLTNLLVLARLSSFLACMCLELHRRYINMLHDF